MKIFVDYIENRNRALFVNTYECAAFLLMKQKNDETIEEVRDEVLNSCSFKLSEWDIEKFSISHADIKILGEIEKKVKSISTIRDCNVAGATLDKFYNRLKEKIPFMCRVINLMPKLKVTILECGLIILFMIVTTFIFQI